MSDDYTTGDRKYPTSLQSTLNFFEKHSKSVVRAPISHKGVSCAQRKGNGNLDTFENNYCEYKEC